MTTVQIEAGEVFASATDRTGHGLLIPFGQVGRTNIGNFAIDNADALELPSDPRSITLNDSHERSRPVARVTTLEAKPEGVFASWEYFDGADADAVLAEARNPQGKRRKLSAEFDAVVRSGKLVAGRLWGGAFVEKGAFQAATVMAADAGELPAAPVPLTPDKDGVIDLAVTAIPTSVVATVPDANGQPTSETATFNRIAEGTAPTEGTPAVVTATAPVFNRSRRAWTPPAAEQVGPNFMQVMAALARIKSGQGSADDHKLITDNAGDAKTVFAALNPIKYSGANQVGTAVNQVPQWLGELYSGRAFRRRFAPLIGHGDLTSMNVAGWRWTTPPTGADYAGNKAAIPSNTPVAAPYSAAAGRFAGGHDHDRAFVDFPNPDYWTSYWRAMTESYEAWADARALNDLLGAATDLEADNPAGLAIGAGLSALIDGAVEVIDNNATPSFAVMSLDLYKQTLKTPQQDVLGYLNAALNLEDGTLENNGFTISGSSEITTGHVLVGAREAATFYELPGVPVRADALDMVNAGVDTGLFGYAGTAIHKADAIVDVAPYTP